MKTNEKIHFLNTSAFNLRDLPDAVRKNIKKTLLDKFHGQYEVWTKPFIRGTLAHEHEIATPYWTRRWSKFINFFRARIHGKSLEQANRTIQHVPHGIQGASFANAGKEWLGAQGPALHEFQVEQAHQQGEQPPGEFQLPTGEESIFNQQANFPADFLDDSNFLDILNKNENAVPELDPITNRISPPIPEFAKTFNLTPENVTTFNTYHVKVLQKVYKTFSSQIRSQHDQDIRNSMIDAYVEYRREKFIDITYNTRTENLREGFDILCTNWAENEHAELAQELNYKLAELSGGNLLRYLELLNTKLANLDAYNQICKENILFSVTKWSNTISWCLKNGQSESEILMNFAQNYIRNAGNTFPPEEVYSAKLNAIADIYSSIAVEFGPEGVQFVLSALGI